VLAGVGIPDKPQQWQREMLERLGAHGNGCSVNLAKREPMFDWRLVAAVRVLCAENEAEFEGVDLQRLGDLNAPLPDKLEVCMCSIDWLCLPQPAAVGFLISWAGFATDVEVYFRFW